MISVYELSRVFKRLSGKPKGEPIKLARFLIETSETEYDMFVETKIGMVCDKLSELLGPYFVFNEQREAEIKLEITQVQFCGK